METMLHSIRHLAYREVMATLADQELLHRFATQRDQDAFTELVRRHAGLVANVCQSILPRTDAEDAFQASFVVLARKVGGLRGESIEESLRSC